MQMDDGEEEEEGGENMPVLEVRLPQLPAGASSSSAPPSPASPGIAEALLRPNFDIVALVWAQQSALATVPSDPVSALPRCRSGVAAEIGADRLAAAAAPASEALEQGAIESVALSAAAFQEASLGTPSAGAGVLRLTSGEVWLMIIFRAIALLCQSVERLFVHPRSDYSKSIYVLTHENFVDPCTRLFSIFFLVE